jgi:hypothetical protein
VEVEPGSRVILLASFVCESCSRGGTNFLEFSTPVPFFGEFRFEMAFL